MNLPDCGDMSCRYAGEAYEWRTNGGCRCDECPSCGRYMTREGYEHRSWCEQKEWRPFWDTDVGRKALEGKGNG